MTYRAAHSVKGWFGHAHREAVLRGAAVLLVVLLAGLAIATVWAWQSCQEPLEVVGSSGSCGAPELLRRVPVDLVWLALIPAFLLLFSTTPSGLSSNYLFASFAIPIALFVFMYSFGYVPYHTLHFNNSATYLQKVLTGTYASNRNSGYSTILVAINRTIGIDRVAWFQFGAIIGCYLTGAWLLSSYLQRKWLAPLIVVMFLAQGTTTTFSDRILTEALFTAGLGLFAASLGAFARQARVGAQMAGAAGIVLAISAKSIGIVLVVPALLVARNSCRRKCAFVILHR